MTLAPLESRVRFFATEQMARTGQTPSPDQIAAALREPRNEVEAALYGLEAKHAVALAPASGALWMVYPFSAVPTPHRVSSDGRVWWANCAWDALAIPPLLEIDAQISSACPDCAGPLTFNFRAGALQPTNAVVHFAVPPKSFWDNVAFT
jgi:hypothetical protein